MTIEEAFWKIQNDGSGNWTIPVKMGKDDIIATETIKWIMERLGDNATTGELIDVAQQVLWWSITVASLWEKKEG